MGNQESNESAAVKRQAEGGVNPMYDLLDLSGGGQLFFITKRAMVKKDYKELDEAIKAKIQPYLYNEGKGAMVPIAQLACLRNRDRSKSKMFPEIRALGEDGFNFVFEGSDLLAKMTEGLDPATSPHLFRESCWMVEKRGAVGETTFHVCFLMQTPTHLALGRRLLKHYPKLINDVYLSEEYYGENVLHMSVVAEDPTMVKYLLDQGIEIHERCYGNFFCPEDQKPSRNDSLDHEYVDVCKETDYAGYVYWGEYPLSFAAVLHQEECFRLILARGANPDLIDTNGNTVTHIMVIYDNMKMFDLAVECGAAINILNNLELTPLTVAAYLAKKDMFFHIANLEREVYWQIGNVCCSAYPIEQLDTINSSTGELQTQSALNLIVFGPTIEHLDLIEGITVDLLKTKWNSFIKKNFYRQIFMFTCFFLVSTFCFVSRPMTPGISCVNQTTATTNATLSTSSMSSIEDFLTTLGNAEDTTASPTEYSSLADVLFNVTLNATSTTTNPNDDEEEEEGGPVYFCDPGLTRVDENICYLHTYDTLLKQVRGILECVLVVWSIIYLGIALREMTFLPMDIFMQNMALCPSRVGFLTGCILCLLTVPLRIFCMPDLENNLALLIMLLTGLYFLFFCRGFKLTGPFVIMIYRMLANDLLKFGAMYFIFVMGFAQCFYIMFQSHIEDEEANPMPTITEAIIKMFMMSLGSFGGIWGELENTNHSFIGKINIFIFLAVVYILLINLLIAMMGDTYGFVAEIKNEWMRQWARTVLIVERGIPPAERLRQQDMYAERMATGEKALVMKQTMSTEQLEEITDIIEMKVSHRKNIKRRRERFGIESNSLLGADLEANANVIAPEDGDEENPFEM